MTVVNSANLFIIASLSLCSFLRSLFSLRSSPYLRKALNFPFTKYRSDQTYRQDGMLDTIAQTTGLAVITIEYRLAPEHPFPQANEDVYDVAEFLVDNGVKEYGASLCFVGGESAGGHLSALTVLHLLSARPNFALKGVVLNYGCFDLTSLPSGRGFTVPLVLTTEDINHFTEAYVGALSLEERKSPDVSPIYHPIFQHSPANTKDGEESYLKNGKKLPPAIFICGTEDALLDDTLLMSAKWQIAGGEQLTKFVPGTCHGFMIFDKKSSKTTADGHKYMLDWILEKQ
jgi:acetyl esterase/lipase